MVINLQVPQKAENFQPTSGSNQFSKMILAHGISILDTRFTTDHDCYNLNVKILRTHTRTHTHLICLNHEWYLQPQLVPQK